MDIIIISFIVIGCVVLVQSLLVGIVVSDEDICK